MSDQATHAIETLLEARGPDRTICPSEAARMMVGEGDDWRANMPAVHEAVSALVDEGRVRLSWKGEAKQEPQGPYRIATAG